MELNKSILLKILSWKYGTLISIVVLVITLNSTLLFFSQLLQQSTSRFYHHGEAKSFMSVNINVHADSPEGHHTSPSEAISNAFASIAAFFEDNIAGSSSTHALCSPPIDIVYTWVNGSDPKHAAGLYSLNILPVDFFGKLGINIIFINNTKSI